MSHQADANRQALAIRITQAIYAEAVGFITGDADEIEIAATLAESYSDASWEAIARHVGTDHVSTDTRMVVRAIIAADLKARRSAPTNPFAGLPR